jgi:glycosyltransferase involved in cell wall biosynthesis
MTRPRVLVAHPILGISGGGNVVAAWALQALREEFQVTLGTLRGVDWQGLNRNFGTSLREGDCAVRIAPPAYQALWRSIPTKGALMEAAVTTRWARDLDARERFDVLLSTQNEMDFGRPGLQYVHFPWAYLPRPEIEMRWFHHIPGVLAAYRAACGWISHSTREGTRRNLFLANSKFVAGKIESYYGVSATILHPPVPGEFPEVPWERRRSAAVAVGRLHQAKRWEMAVDIVERVRSHGFDMELTLICHQDKADYGRRIHALAASRPWFRILSDLTRQQLAHEIAEHRYGIHAMENEHFGIAVAEMVRAGCVTFVHDSGGPVEIVGEKPELRFRDAAEGAAAMAAVLGDSALCERLRAGLAMQRGLYSTEQFCDSLRRVVRGVTPGPPQKS